MRMHVGIGRLVSHGKAPVLSSPTGAVPDLSDHSDDNLDVVGRDGLAKASAPNGAALSGLLESSSSQELTGNIFLRGSLVNPSLCLFP